MNCLIKCNCVNRYYTFCNFQVESFNSHNYLLYIILNIYAMIISNVTIYIININVHKYYYDGIK